MAYKNIEDRRANWNRWYARHKKEFAERQIEYRKTKAGKDVAQRTAKKMMDKYPEKWKARQALRNAIFRGKIKKQLCLICNEKKVEAHHDDYSKPLEVKWLCTIHHKTLHGVIK